MTEQEARKADYAVRIGRFDFKGNGKAKEIGKPQASSSLSKPPVEGSLAWACLVRYTASQPHQWPIASLVQVMLGGGAKKQTARIIS